MTNAKNVSMSHDSFNIINLINPIKLFNCRFLAALVLLATLVASSLQAAIPAPEKILPDDTLLILTAPDFAKLRTIYKASPQSQFLNDPAMKPFKDKFISRLQED